MDSRIRQHAEILVSHSAGVEAGDQVVVSVPAAAEDLAVALFERIGDLGAAPVMTYGGGTAIGTDRAARGYLEAVDEADIPESAHLEALYEEADAIIRARAHANATEHSDVSPSANAALSRATDGPRREMLDSRWVLTQIPTPADAQLAGMSTAAYETFVWDAINKDWTAQREHQSPLVDILEDGDEVTIRSGEKTDLRLRLDGNPAQNDSGEHNLPGGEVFTAPLPDSVEGTVHFDLPVYHKGREITDVVLEFENGEVVDSRAGSNEETLTGVLETDGGARRIGELGIGMNRDIDHFTYNMLFDEKMGDTVHLALGNAYEDTVASENEVNQSAVHLDMIVDMSQDSVIEVDGEVVQQDGTFIFEE